MSDETNGPPRVIARRLAIGFGSVTLTAAVLCVALVLMLGRVAGHVSHMRADESAIRDGLALSQAVREQYIHAAHTIVEGDRSHLDHYVEWAARVESGARALLEVAPPDERARLERVVLQSRELDRVFRARILPAVERGDHEAVRAAHRDAERLSAAAARDADAVAGALERRMASAHVDALGLSKTGVTTAVIGILILVVAAAGFTLKLRGAVLRPLERLAEAARRIGRGDLAARVGPTGEGELRAVAGAFDRMVDELGERERRLVQSERMAAIGQLAAGIAHEINNPIGVIRGYLRTMLPEAPTEELREELRILDEEATACQRITEDLLAYARAPELAPEQVAMAELCEDAARRFAGTADGRDRDVRVEAERATIEADPVRLRQVLSNLLRNAAQASAAPAPIELRGDRVAGGGYRIVVADRGRGLPEGAGARIFEPFFTDKAGGTGLGLAVCLGIVRSHGGSIDARPRPGGGAELLVTLPGGPR